MENYQEFVALANITAHQALAGGEQTLSYELASIWPRKIAITVTDFLEKPASSSFRLSDKKIAGFPTHWGNDPASNSNIEPPVGVKGSICAYEQGQPTHGGEMQTIAFAAPVSVDGTVDWSRATTVYPDAYGVSRQVQPLDNNTYMREHRLALAEAISARVYQKAASLGYEMNADGSLTLNQGQDERRVPARNAEKYLDTEIATAQALDETMYGKPHTGTSTQETKNAGAYVRNAYIQTLQKNGKSLALAAVAMKDGDSATWGKFFVNNPEKQLKDVRKTAKGNTAATVYLDRPTTVYFGKNASDRHVSMEPSEIVQAHIAAKGLSISSPAKKERALPAMPSGGADGQEQSAAYGT